MTIERMLLWLISPLLVLILLAACDNPAGTGYVDGDQGGDICPCPEGCNPDGSCKGDACVTDMDCPPGEYCEGGACYPFDPGGDESEGGIKPDGDLPFVDGDLIGDQDWELGDDFADGDELYPTDGDEDYDIEFETDIPHHPDNPWIMVDPKSIDFGAVPHQTSEIKSVMVWNAGKADLHIDKVYLYYSRNDDDPELEVYEVDLPITLAYEEETEIGVKYTALDLDPDFDLLVIHSNDPTLPNVGVDIFTDVKEVSSVEVYPPLIDFGIVRLLRYSDQVFVRNLAGLEVYILGVRLEEPSQEFFLEDLPEDLQQGDIYTLMPFAELPIKVVYDPLAADGIEDEATLLIDIGGEYAEQFAVPISGTTCEPKIDLLPTVLAYPGVPFGANETKCASVTNKGCWDLEISDILMTDDGGGAYRWNPLPGTSHVLVLEETVDLCVQYSPQLAGDNEGEISIHSNDLVDSTVILTLTSSFAPPDIDCQPEALDFGQVDLVEGQSEVRTVICRNLGPETLEIEQIVVEDPVGVYLLSNQVDMSLPTGEEATIDIAYTPLSPGVDSGMLSIHSNDPDEALVEIPLDASAYYSNRCPVALISIIAPPIDQIKQYDTVQLDGTGSGDPDAGDSVAKYFWTLENKPADSFAHLSSVSDSKPTLEVDKPGSYRIKLEVFDETDTPSCEVDYVEFVAAAPEPDISCEPAILDFGDVAEGSSRPMTVICRNLGYGLLQISQYEVETPPTDVFTITNTPDTELGYSASTFIEITYTPGSTAPYTGALRVHSNDPDQNPVIIQLGGGSFEPNKCPVAEFSITSPPIDNIRQFDTVQFNALASYDPDPQDFVYQYIWTLEQAPAGSQSSIRPWGVPAPNLYVDQPGLYRISLHVKDSFDTISCEAAVLEFTALAPLPDILCSPMILNFGSVSIRGSRTLQTTCTNYGMGTLTLDPIEVISPVVDIFSLANSPQTSLDYMESTSIEVLYEPAEVRDYNGQLNVNSNDPDQGLLEIPLLGAAYDPNNCPVARILVSSPDLGHLMAWETIHFDGTGSFDTDVGDAIAQYEWSVVSRPAGSTSQIQTSSSAEPTFYVDQPGVYGVQLVVYDLFGLESCEPALIEFQAGTPPPDIHCTPLVVDYGEVPIGDSLLRTVTCSNQGLGPLHVANYQVLSPIGSVFELANSPATLLNHLDSTDIEIRYSPVDVFNNSGQMIIASDDPDEPLVTIQLIGNTFNPNNCPSAVIGVISPDLNNLYVGDSILFDGTGSFDSDPGDSVVEYLWSITARPAGSTSEPQTVNSSQPTFYVDAEGDYTIRLEVKDSYNLVNCDLAELSFHAQLSPPDIQCNPMILDYGTVSVGDQLNLTTTCSNVGRVTLNISQYEVQSPGAGVFSLVNSPDTVLGFMESTQVSIRYSPQATGGHNGLLRIHSDDPDENPLDIVLTGSGYVSNRCPVAQFTTDPDVNSDTIRPLDTIDFDGRSSYDPDAGDNIAEYIWTVVQRPNGSTSQMQNGASARPSLFVDLAGHFRIRLEVRDNHGLLSCTPVEVQFDVIPGERIHVQLVWDTNEGDHDLHLIRPGGSFWNTSSDCFYQRMNPNWGQHGHPSLDIDDQHGYGPENINLDDPGNGDYEVYVHYYNSWGEHDTGNVTVRIYIWGVIEGEFTIPWPESNEHDKWHAATIRWNGNEGEVIGRGYVLENDGHGQKGAFDYSKK